MIRTKKKKKTTKSKARPKKTEEKEIKREKKGSGAEEQSSCPEYLSISSHEISLFFPLLGGGRRRRVCRILAGLSGEGGKGKCDLESST